jgi:hypothetical protein
MQTLRKLSSKKGKFEGIQLGEVVSKNRNDNKYNQLKETKSVMSPHHNISHVITHTEPSSSIKGNKENITKRAEKVVSAIQKRYDNNKKIVPKEHDIQSPIISIKLVKNESPKYEKKITPIKPKLVSPTQKKVSFEKKDTTQIKPKLVSPILNKSVLKNQSPIAPSIKKKESSIVNKSVSYKNNRISPMNKPIIKYNIYEVRTILSNYEQPKQPYINDYRYKTYTQYYNIYHNMRNFIDRFLLTNLSKNIKFI